jgi:hypothetical protein
MKFNYYVGDFRVIMISGESPSKLHRGSINRIKPDALGEYTTPLGCNKIQPYPKEVNP